MLGVILAAGKGTRMKSQKPKVMFEICGKPMVSHVISAIQGAGVESVALIVGYKSEILKDFFMNDSSISFFEQKEQLGTGHALMQVDYSKYDDEYVFIIPGDEPLFDSEKLKRFIDFVKEKSFDAAILSTVMDEPFGYGRIIRDGDGYFEKIVEQKDASEEEKRVKEVNTGVYMVKKKLLEKYLSELETKNAQGEYYLTDIFYILKNKGFSVAVYAYDNPKECIGVNSRYQLYEASKYFKMNYLKKLMQAGVTIENPEGVVLHGKLHLEKDVTIISPVVFKGDVIAESGAVLGPYLYVENSSLKAKEYSFAKIVDNIKESILIQGGDYNEKI